MAKRKYSAMKRSKIEPAVQTMQLALPSTSAGATTTSYVDLSQIASILNRRFYRQGINWAVGSMKFISATPVPGTTLSGTVQVSKLWNSWTMSNSWKKGMQTWMRMNAEALSETEGIRPRFLDFKVYADAAHHQKGFAGNLLPTGLTTVAVPGEWEPSKVVIPLTDGSDNAFSREFIATGANYPGNSAITGLNAVSLIEGYAASRLLPNVLDPNAPDDAASVNGATPQNWLAAVFNQGTDQDDLVLDDMITENNIAPYPFENDGVNADTMYVGGANQTPGLQVHDTTNYGATTIGGTTMIKGGNFPCGLIRIDHIVNPTSEAHNLVLQIGLIPGSHRGYLCEPMTEM